MVSDDKIKSAFNLVASMLAFAAVGLGITALNSNFWVYTSTYNSGLWLVCTTSQGCFYISDPPSWLQAVRAFMIMMVIVAFFSGFSNFALHWKRDKKVQKAPGGGFGTAAIFGIIAAAVYTGFSSPLFSPNGYTQWGIGFIYSWVCPGALLIANAFHLGYVYSKSSEPYDTRV